MLITQSIDYWSKKTLSRSFLSGRRIGHWLHYSKRFEERLMIILMYMVLKCNRVDYCEQQKLLENIFLYSIQSNMYSIQIKFISLSIVFLFFPNGTYSTGNIHFFLILVIILKKISYFFVKNVLSFLGEFHKTMGSTIGS